jgi:hypothetical protein
VPVARSASVLLMQYRRNSDTAVRANFQQQQGQHAPGVGPTPKQINKRFSLRCSPVFVVSCTGRGRGGALRTADCGLRVGRISWLRRVRLGSPLGHGNFLSGLKLSGERGGGLGLARFSAVCPLGGHMYANGLLWHADMAYGIWHMAGAACMGLTT